ncbi:CAAX prenyl protease-related protein [Pelomonas sp. SE-A7]|uniref:CAAX prenyl protease-related protein n=1 Tax=Pelomonas sp. SE-A7 TaxID=3054953 RepID=UPI00259CB1BD|nr:CAAX prenyl protease-related protein [Pelomonas sp. SE-A7]MDM4768380.1 CAAX prenyl protease-related protein [Pelomonas sp. SE-A7]
MTLLQRFHPAALARCLPFAVFMALLGLRGALPEGLQGLDPRWIYGLGVLVVGGLLLHYRREYGELSRQNLPDASEWLISLGVGVLVFVLWIKLDAPWMQLGTPTASFVPLDAQGGLIWPLVVMRLLGAALLVPVMEELFWRSFLMRWIAQPQFQTVAPRDAGLKALVLSTFIFMLAHTLWLAAIVAGLAYALLYMRTGKLWTAVIAHAVTNGALGLWVIRTGNWQFW